MNEITSRNNPLVDEYRTLARQGPAAGAEVLLDGFHLIDDACAAGIRIRTAAVSRTVLARAEAADLVGRIERGGATVAVVTDDVLRAMSPTRTPSGLVAIAAMRPVTLDAALARAPQLVFLLVDVQDPGNAGAVIRSAEAAGATGVVCCGTSTDPLGWKALRGSMGSAFRVPVVRRTSTADALQASRAAGLTVVATVKAGGRDLFAVDLTRPIAFVLGGEGPGLG
ncbi:MAG: RNA methyltransferase, partial [Acidobacteria bacterium]|nr:RNA methyltransferase [Acidobacteriota bacterium]